MLDYDKDCFKRICKGIKIKTCCYILVVAVMVTIRHGFAAVTKAVTMVNDCWPVVILSADHDLSICIDEDSTCGHSITGDI